MGNMRKPTVFPPIVLALGTIIPAPAGVVRADEREEGPIEVEKYNTISRSGSYKLVGNVSFRSTTGVCLNITTNNVTIDLAGFTISGPDGFNTSTAVLNDTALGRGVTGIAVRNGSISGFLPGWFSSRSLTGKS